MKKFLKKVVIRDDYMTRWHLIPRNKYCNIYLHRFHSSDDAILHDHPWWSVSFLLKGCLWEELRAKSGRCFDRRIPWLWPVYRRAKMLHRLDVYDSPVWTLFITGPVSRRWGFSTPAGWVDAGQHLSKPGRAAGLKG